MELNEFSKKFADKLFQLFPNWREFARIFHEYEGGPGNLEITVPSPSDPKIKLWIYIDSENDVDEITIGFGEYHGHYSYDTEDKVIEKALKFIREIVDEEIVIVEVQEDMCRMSRYLKPRALAKFLDKNKKATVWSWHGNYNRS